MNIQLTAKGQEHIRKVVDHFMPQERVHLNNDFFAKYGIETSELSDDELYQLCQEKNETDNIWFSLATLWEI
jgi:hypothetical protein